ncbi:hypothetical protein [Trinickia mobilis]|uniref:hypothetical protein n=1 Tax=Trinickia mobilis TaxID=2816356 RepID=UPI001A90AC8B|nr:hypothetical protein [Trinickia mobilis]
MLAFFAGDFALGNASIAFAPQCGQNDTGLDTRPPQLRHVAEKVELEAVWLLIADPVGDLAGRGDV